MKNYKPSRNFLISTGLLVLSFFIMQGIVVPSLVKDDLVAAALRSQSVQPALISGIFRKSAWEEFDEKAKTIRETNVSYYIEKADGKTTTLTPKGKVDESLIDQYVDYDPLTKTIVPSVSGKTDQRKPVTLYENHEQPEFGEGSNDEPEKIDSVVFLVQFADSTPVNMTADEYKNRLFGPFGWIKKFYGDMTHGDIVMGADVYGWYTYPEAGVYSGNGNCNLTGGDVQEIADFYNIDLLGYERVITITNCEDYETLGGLATAMLGIPWVRIAGHYDRLSVDSNFSYSEDFPGLIWNMIHEIGHTFTDQWHANSLDCQERVVWIDCVAVGYGNPFDVMGHWGGRIFSFINQEKAGWIGENNILNITEPGIYHLDNLQTEGGTVAAKIHGPGTYHPIFAVEHRKASGFDERLNGSNVAEGLILYSNKKTAGMVPSWPVVGSSSRFSNIVDPHPTPDPIFDDIVDDAITETNPFLDDITGIGINIIDVTSGGIDFSVSYNYSDSFCGYDASLDELISSVNAATPIFTYNQKFIVGINFSPSAFESICKIPRNFKIELIENGIPNWNPGVLDKVFSNDFTISGAILPSYVTFDEVLINNVPAGVYNLTFKITDLGSGENQYYSLPIEFGTILSCDIEINDIVTPRYQYLGTWYNFNSNLVISTPVDNSNMYLFLNFEFDYQADPNCPTKHYSISPSTSNLFQWGYHTFFFPIHMPVTFDSSQSSSYSIYLPQGTGPGTYNIDIQITDEATGESVQKTINVSVI